MAKKPHAEPSAFAKGWQGIASAAEHETASVNRGDFSRVNSLLSDAKSAFQSQAYCGTSEGEILSAFEAIGRLIQAIRNSSHDNAKSLADTFEAIGLFKVLTTEPLALAKARERNKAEPIAA